MKNYINLLNSKPVLKRLSTIQLIVYFGAWFSNVAIYTLLLELDVDESVIALVAMLHFLAGIIQAPFSGTIIDSFEPKKLLTSLIVVEFFTTISLLFVQNINDLTLLYILIFFKMSAASFYFTTEMSLLPKILNNKELQSANELHSIIWSFSYTLGMALSGFVVYSFSIKVAFLLDALMFLSAFLLILKLPLHITRTPQKQNIIKMMQKTFHYIKQTPHALHLMLLHAFVGITAFDALVALMAKNYYSSLIATSLAIGLIHSSRAIGLVIGPILLSKYLNNAFVIKVFIAQALSIWLWAFVMHNFYLSLLASILVGIFTTTLWSYTYTLLQTNIDEKFYGRVIAYNDMLFLSSATLTSFFIGFLATHNYSLPTITFLMGCGFGMGGVYFWWVDRKYL